MYFKEHERGSRNFLIYAGLTFALLNAAACSGLSQSTAKTVPPKPEPAKSAPNAEPTKESRVMSEKIISAIRGHDRTVLDQARSAPEGIAVEIDEVIGSLDNEAREIATELVAMQDSKQAGTFLLRRTADTNVNVATVAVENLGKIINKPEANDLIAAIPERPDAFVRGKMYLEAGNRQDEFVLDEIRRVSMDEKNNDVKLRSLAARAKRGGRQEISDFMEVVRRTEPDDALDIQALLLYINNPKLAGALLPWLDNKEGVMRIGSDRQNMMASMADVAVWTVHMLKIKLPFETTHLRNYTPEEIETVRKLLQTI